MRPQLGLEKSCGVGIWQAAAASQWFGRNVNMVVNGNLGYARGLMLGGL
jgi:hypothetical protein